MKGAGGQGVGENVPSLGLPSSEKKIRLRITEFYLFRRTEYARNSIPRKTKKLGIPEHFIEDKIIRNFVILF